MISLFQSHLSLVKLFRAARLRALLNLYATPNATRIFSAFTKSGSWMRSPNIVLIAFSAFSGARRAARRTAPVKIGCKNTLCEGCPRYSKVIPSGGGRRPTIVISFCFVFYSLLGLDPGFGQLGRKELCLIIYLFI